MRPLPLVVSSALMLVPLTAFAFSFSDVPKTSEFADAITALTDAGVISGNPDGTFRPQNPVNRAAMLKMAYKAANITPMGETNCFPKDVPSDSWYATYVCDAARKKIVSGYDDGSFRPNSFVTVAEGLKMVMETLDIPAPAIVADDLQILPFKVSRFAWYAPYLVEATRRKILPLPGQGIDFYANDPLDRQQAAELVYRAWNILLDRNAANSAAASSRAAMKSSASSSSTMTGSGSSSSRSASIVQDLKPEPDVRNVIFPWKDEWQLSGKESMLYRFTLKTRSILDVDVALRGTNVGTIACRLYHLEKDGLANEYYIGVQTGQGCQILATVGAGDYQLELSSDQENAPYSVEVAPGVGDGNDGLIQAQTLIPGVIRQGFFPANDLEDWYTFSVVTEFLEGIPLILSTTSDGDLGCEILPWTNVSLPSFTEPACNVSMLFPSGTYYVRVKHLPPVSGKRVYTLMLRAQ